MTDGMFVFVKGHHVNGVDLIIIKSSKEKKEQERARKVSK
jgi:hypothetical protein